MPTLKETSNQHDYYILHLEDKPEDRNRLDGMIKGITDKFEHFYAENFAASQLEIERLELEPVKVTLRVHRESDFWVLPTHLFDSPGKIKAELQRPLFFLIDYFLRDQRGNEVNIHKKATSLEGMSVARWLNYHFPTIPKVLLTVGRTDQVTIPKGWAYLPKSELKNPHGFLRKLGQFFPEWWGAPFWKALDEYANERGRTSWHTPGHNAGNAFVRSAFQQDLYGAFGPGTFATDLSVSVDELGDLSEPLQPSALSEAQRNAANVFGAAETIFITNGTSTSNKSLLGTLLRPGEVVLLDRNCHKSVHQAVAMSGAVPLYLQPAFNERLGVWEPLSFDLLKRAICHTYFDDELKPRMLVLTTCTYEGVLYPVHRIHELCDANGILFHADEAWAPYLRFHPFYEVRESTDELVPKATAARYAAAEAVAPVPDEIGEEVGADFVAQSTHKALAAFSQASMIHITRTFYKHLESSKPQWSWLRQRFNMPEAVADGAVQRFRHELDENLRYWHSTSPNYPMLATLDRAGVQMRLEGLHLLSDCLNEVERLTREINGLVPGRRRRVVLGLEDIVGQNNFGDFQAAQYAKDPLKLLIGFRSASCLDKFKKALLAKKIQYEKSTKTCIEFLVTIGTFESHFDALKELLRENQQLLGLTCPKKPSRKNRNTDLLKDSSLEVSPHFALHCRGEMVDLRRAEGRISAQMLVPYPPGIPLVLPGLCITESVLKKIADATKGGKAASVHGLMDTGKRGRYMVKVLTLQEIRDFSANKEWKRLRGRVKVVERLRKQLN